MSLTLAYDDGLSRVRITADGLRPAAAALIERSTDQVRWSTVRGGAAATVTDGALLVPVDDYEFSADVENFYRVRRLLADGTEIGAAANANPLFESGVTNWLGSNGATVASSGTQHHEGSLALRLTPNGSTANPNAQAEEIACTPGTQFGASAWLWTTAAATWGVGVAWENSSHSVILVQTNSMVLGAQTWTNLWGVFTAPAGAAYARLIVSATGTLGATNLLYVDEAYLCPVGMAVASSNSATPELDTVWLKSLAHPYLNRPITVTDYSDVVRPARSSSFGVIGRTMPVAVSDVRGGRQWAMEVRVQASAGGFGTFSTESTGDDLTAETLDAILAAGDVMFIHCPADCTVPGGYVLIGDVTVARRIPRATKRYFTLPCTEVAAPGPDVVGATSTWQTVLDTYATWADLIAANATWGDLLELIGDPTEVITA